MTEENQIKEYENRIAELEKQLKEATETKGFEDIKKKYEDLINEKDKTIQELQKTVDETQAKVDDTITDLNNEVDEKLKQNEEYKQLLATVKQLEKDKAEATVDTYIQKGIIIPKQRDVAVKLCLNDPDTFTELYRDAKPIIELDPKPHSKKVDEDINKIVDFFEK